MSGLPDDASARVPTLTDEVSWPHADAALADPPVVPPVEQPVEQPSTGPKPVDLAAPAAATGHGELPIDEAELNRRVLAEVHLQIDLMFEYRLREALLPSLARVNELLLREARVELASTLRDVVARAVAQEISRLRPR